MSPSPSPSQVKQALRRYILSQHLKGESPSNLHDDARLRSTGVLDSLATLGLIGFIEKTYGFELTAEDMAMDHLDTIDDMAALVARKGSS